MSRSPLLPLAAFSSWLLRGRPPAPPVPPDMSTPPASALVEQHKPGARPALPLLVSFDGLGAGFTGPQGPATVRSPSDNSLAAGPHHIVQTVNSRMAVFDKAGNMLPRPVPPNSEFKGLGGTCEQR